MGRKLGRDEQKCTKPSEGYRQTQERSADALPWLWQWVFKVGSEVDGFKCILEVESIAFS